MEDSIIIIVSMRKCELTLKVLCDGLHMRTTIHT